MGEQDVERVAPSEREVATPINYLEPADFRNFTQAQANTFNFDEAAGNALLGRNNFNVSDKNQVQAVLGPLASGDAFSGLASLVAGGPVDGLEDRMKLFKDVMKDLGIDVNVIDMNGRLKININHTGQNSGLSFELDKRTGTMTMQEFDRNADPARLREMFNNRTTAVLRDGGLFVTRGPGFYPSGLNLAQTIRTNLQLNYSGRPA